MFNYEEALALLERYADRYYNNDAEITDAEYDKLLFNLTEYEKNHNITRELLIGAKGWDVSIPHKYQQMYSLDNVVTPQQLFDRLKGETVAMPKLDGISLGVYYSGGAIEMVLTRGDGEKGKDVSHLAKSLNIPMRISITGNVRIEGEAYCKTFKAGEYKNHRNMVAGAMRLQSEDEFKTRNVEFIAYNAVEEKPASDLEFTDILKSLDDNGFQVVDHILGRSVLDKDVFAKEFPFTDGIVYKLNDCNKWVGFTSHHPQFAFAYKFPEEEYTTTLVNIEWGMGKLGRITPVAILDPVEIEGSTVGRASLSNMNIIRALGLCVGDTVSIIKAKSIIPQIISVVGKGSYSIPIEIRNCPCCSEPTEERRGLVYCTNKHCGGSLPKEVSTLTKVLGIKGMGPAAIEALIAKKMVVRPTDVFSLSIGNVESLSGNSDAIWNSIQTAKLQPRYKLWAALCIPGIGLSSAKALYKAGVTSLLDLSFDDIIIIKGFGDKTADSVIQWVDNNSDYLEKSEALFPNLEPIQEGETAASKGTVCITGKMDVTRVSIKEKLESLGWTVVPGVTKKVNFLLTGEKGGSKIDKARQYGIQVVDYYECRREWGL